MNKKTNDKIYQNELIKRQEKKLQKQFPKIPKRKITKEEIKLKQEKRKARCENICCFLITIFFLIMLAVSIYILYLMWNYKW